MGETGKRGYVKTKQKKTKLIDPELELWQERLAKSDAEYSGETEKMDDRERLFNGDENLEPVVKGDKKNMKTPHVRNIVFENIETQVSSTLPAPKVTPRREKDEKLANIIEHFLRNEMDRLPFERVNDMAERTVPMQGGTGYAVDWDHTQGNYERVGELTLDLVHPKQFGPQPGVYTGIDDMDWFIVKMPTTKGAIFRKYGVDITDESESEPELRKADGVSTSEDSVTEYIGYQRNERGGIDKFCWVNDTVLENLKNYQARRQPVCKGCGRMQPTVGQKIRKESPPTGNLLPNPELGFVGALLPEDGQAVATVAEEEIYNGGACPWCGGEEFAAEEQEYEEIYVPFTSPGGVVIPGEHMEVGEDGVQRMVPTKIPYYRPNVFPIILQKSVSVYGQLLGNSDVDQIRTQQNSINRLEKKILERLCKAGTRYTLPNKAAYKLDGEDGEVWRVESPADKQMIDVYQFSGNLQYEMTYLSQVYEEARQILGITDSLQGRHDPTATSGKAKEFSAARAAGRMESKRVMKNAAYAQIFEVMFKFALAYSDEPRAVSYKNHKGETVYEEFNRYDFLEQDSDGNWHYNDQFLFSCDTAAPLASNREAMWQEIFMNFQRGAFGNPAESQSQILLWELLELNHYPLAGAIKKNLEEKQKQAEQAAQKQAEQMAQMQAAAGAANGQMPAAPGMVVAGQ